MSPSRQLRVARWIARHLERPMLASMRSVAFARARTEILARIGLRGRDPFRFESATMGGVPVRRRPGETRGTFLYIHGGAFFMLSARTHQGVAAAYARPLGLEPLLPDFRRPPEHPHPAPLDDIAAVYRAARPPIVLAGDSAGGGMALGLLHRILAEGWEKPAAVLALSPWADLTLRGESLSTNAESEPLLPVARLPEVAAAYLGGTDARDPEVSPVFGAFAGAPPVLIQAIAGELLLSDARAAAARLEACGAPVTLQIFPHGMHSMQILHTWLPEADRAVADGVDFARAALG